MPQVDARLAEIVALINAENPYGRLTGTVYLDAQAVVQWIRLSVFEEVLALLKPGHNRLRRFRIQDAVYHETVGVLAKRFGVAPAPEVEAYLHSHPELQIDGPYAANSVLGRRSRALQLQVAIQAGEDPATIGSRHRGEAETLAIIEQHEPGAIFVTADKDAIKVAKDAGIGHAVRPSGFTAGALQNRADVTRLWTHVCLARLCVGDDYNPACVKALECNDLTSASAERSPISRTHLKAADSLDWALADLHVLVERLVDKGD